MTKMLPNTPHSGSTRSEKDVFRLIKEAEETGGYYCLHSLGIARHERKEYAESDFVIVGPEGVFCLEVKGGEIRRRDGLWEIGWPGKTYTSREGPFKQAQGTRWPLKRELINRLGTRIGNEVLFGWGVVFPDVIFLEKDPEWDPDLIYDQRDKTESFVKYIKRLHRYFIERLKKLGRSGFKKIPAPRIQEIVDCLRGDFEIILSLRGLINDSRRELIRLGADQYRLLDMVLDPDNPRILCEGGAGTGKTLLALEVAKRLSRPDRRILVLCYNRQLENHLHNEVRSIGGSVEVYSLYRLLGDWIKKAGLGPRLQEVRSTKNERQLFDDEYPRLFEEAVLRMMEEGEFRAYDLIIIDEAQDILSTNLMNCISDITDGGLADGSWLIFYDPGFQSGVYGRMNNAVLQYLKSLRPVPFKLLLNYRNPRSIVDEMATLIRIDPPECARLITSQVEYMTFRTEKEQGKKLRGLLIGLMRDGIKPSDVTILSFYGRENSCAGGNPPDTGKPIRFLDDAHKGSVEPGAFTASSISTFKGLENEIIILTDIPDPRDMTDWVRAALYVGMTRARTKLYALVGQEFVEYRTDLMTDWLGGTKA